jgi:hypothetical protein
MVIVLRLDPGHISGVILGRMRGPLNPIQRRSSTVGIEVCWPECCTPSWFFGELLRSVPHLSAHRAVICVGIGPPAHGLG